MYKNVKLHIEDPDASTPDSASLARSTAGAPSKSYGPQPRPMAFWREYLEKSGGVIQGPNGEEFPVSLEEWADADDSKLLNVYVSFIDPNLVGTKDPEGRPDTSGDDPGQAAAARC